MPTDNLLYSNKYEITMPLTPITASMVKSIEIVGMTVGEVNIPYQELDILVPGEKSVFGKLEITFLVDENLDSYMECFNEIQAVVGPHSKLESRKERYQDITITFLNNKSGAATRRMVFHDSWITFLGNLPMDNGPNEPISVFLTVNYHDMKFITLDNDLTGFEKTTYTTNIQDSDVFKKN